MIRRTIAAMAALALLWSIVNVMTGGGTLTFAGLRISSTDPIRPLIAAALLFAVYGLASGRQRLRDDVSYAREVATAPRLAGLLAVAVGVVAV